MQSINTVKRRIHSIETIKKITTAMKLIASIKLKKQKVIIPYYIMLIMSHKL